MSSKIASQENHSFRRGPRSQAWPLRTFIVACMLCASAVAACGSDGDGTDGVPSAEESRALIEELIASYNEGLEEAARSGEPGSVEAFVTASGYEDFQDWFSIETCDPQRQCLTALLDHYVFEGAELANLEFVDAVRANAVSVEDSQFGQVIVDTPRNYRLRRQGIRANYELVFLQEWRIDRVFIEGGESCYYELNDYPGLASRYRPCTD